MYVYTKFMYDISLDVKKNYKKQILFDIQKQDLMKNKSFYSWRLQGQHDWI